jgi:hypothetical protein
MLSTYVSYQFVTRDLSRSLEVTASDPVNSRETDYYRENIVKVKSVDDFIGDDRLFSYAMRAHGLEDMIYAKAFIRKVLEEGVDDTSSFANSLTDRRYREFTATFNFARYGETTVAFDRTQSGTIERYTRYRLEQSAGETNEGVRLALYFERRASEISSPLDILADPALLKVAQTALSISLATAALDIEKQADMIGERLDIEDLKEPDKLAAFLQRFTALWDLSNETQGAQAPNVLAGQPIEFGINQDILTSLQNLKLTGR